jgi:predicted nucleic acid-binding protein
VDSSGWLEYFVDGPKAFHFEEPLSNRVELLVPTICIYEVFKVVLRESGEDDALQALALMKQGEVADLTETIAFNSAKISVDHHLPMADSIILATARSHDSLIWTLDSDFKTFKNVKLF